MVRILSFDPAIKNIGMCILDFDNETKQINKIIEMQLLDISRGKPCKSIKFDNLMDNLIEALENVNLDGVDTVLIENQPSLQNPKVKSVAVALFVFFKQKKEIKEVKFVSPSKKLSKDENKLNYQQRKKKGIEKAHNLLSDENKKRLLGFKKKSDICDCILNAYYFLN